MFDARFKDLVVGRVIYSPETGHVEVHGHQLDEKGTVTWILLHISSDTKFEISNA